MESHSRAVTVHITRAAQSATLVVGNAPPHATAGPSVNDAVCDIPTKYARMRNDLLSSGELTTQ